MLASSFGSVLRQAREVRELSAVDAARAAGISAAYLSKLENGAVKKPSPHVLLQLSDLLRVAGKTGVRYIVRKRDLQGRMGVPVAAKTPLEFEVRLPHVAVAALRNGFLYGRRMAFMTTRTPHVLVLPS